MNCYKKPIILFLYLSYELQLRIFRGHFNGFQFPVNTIQRTGILLYKFYSFIRQI